MTYLHINGPSANSKELLEIIYDVFANEKHNKIPHVYSLGKTKASSSTQTEDNVEIAVKNCEQVRN